MRPVYFYVQKLSTCSPLTHPRGESAEGHFMMIYRDGKKRHRPRAQARAGTKPPVSPASRLHPDGCCDAQLLSEHRERVCELQHHTAERGEQRGGVHSLICST